MNNMNSQLDKQNAEHGLAFVTPEEHAEYQTWLASQPITIPIEAQTTAFEVAIERLDNTALELAFEFGFLCAEKGMNLQEAKARLRNTTKQ